MGTRIHFRFLHSLGLAVLVSILSLSNRVAADEGDIDDVGVTVEPAREIPEPATIVLFGLACIGMATLHAKRRKRAG